MAIGRQGGRRGFGWRRLVGLVAIAGLAVSTAQAARAQQCRPYGGNFGWSYSTPQTTYYNGPAYGMYGPYGPYPYPYSGNGGGGNVQYFRRGRNAFWVETYRDQQGNLRQRTGQLYYGGQ